MKEYLKLIPRNGKRESSIEILRIYACILVVLAHIQLGYAENGEIFSPGILWIKCMIADNVPIFFTILGYFLFVKVQDEDRIKKIPYVFVDKLKGFLIRIYIPTIIVTLLCCFAFDYIYGQKSFGELFTNPSFHGELFTNYVYLQQPMDMVGQFWYIISYIKILIFFPLYAFICVDEKLYNRIRRIYMLLCFLVMVGGDFYYLANMEPIINLDTYIFDSRALFVLVGYEIFLFFKKTEMKRSGQILLGLIMYVGGISARYGLTMLSFQQYGVGNSDHFMMIDCSISYISAAGVMILFISLIKMKPSGIIQFLGEMTLYVFMLHGAMMRIFDGWGQKTLAGLDYGRNLFQCLEFYAIYGGLLIMVSFLLGLIIREVYAVIRYLCHRGCYGKTEN